MPVQAQFNTIAKTPERYKVEALQEGMKKQEPTPESAAPVQETSVKSADKRKQSWIDRYLSVSYPLQRTATGKTRLPGKGNFTVVSTCTHGASRHWP